jgi:NAD(P)-dependent dehydrogenase (short-subunit alcohol dehydrogenase family)
MKATEMNRIDLGGKVALVNGASRGIGEAIARGLADCGAQVILSSRDRVSVQQVADSIAAEGGTAARSCHAGRLAEIDALFASIAQDFGRLDILINNAATNPWFGPAAELPPAAFDKTVDVNLKGPYYMMSRAVPLMIAGGGGSIVNVASIAALVSMSGQAVYAMTKAGLVSLTRAFARNTASRGCVNNLPGADRNRLAAALVADRDASNCAPTGAALQPTRDVVSGVLFLVSDGQPTWHDPGDGRRRRTRVKGAWATSFATLKPNKVRSYGFGAVGHRQDDLTQRPPPGDRGERLGKRSTRGLRPRDLSNASTGTASSCMFRDATSGLMTQVPQTDDAGFLQRGGGWKRESRLWRSVTVAAVPGRRGGGLLGQVAPTGHDHVHAPAVGSFGVRSDVAGSRPFRRRQPHGRLQRRAAAAMTRAERLGDFHAAATPPAAPSTAQSRQADSVSAERGRWSHG